MEREINEHKNEHNQLGLGTDGANCDSKKVRAALMEKVTWNVVEKKVGWNGNQGKGKLWVRIHNVHLSPWAHFHLLRSVFFVTSQRILLYHANLPQQP